MIIVCWKWRGEEVVKVGPLNNIEYAEKVAAKLNSFGCIGWTVTPFYCC